MDFVLSDEQQMLRDGTRRFLEEKAPLSRVREWMESERGYDPALWAEMATQGWQAMAIPEEDGGAGFTEVEQGILMEEMGRALLPSPFFATVVLGATTLMVAGRRRELLAAVAAGESLLALATEPPADRPEAAVSAQPHADGWALTGTAAYVVDGAIADHVIVYATEPDALFLVDAASPGLDRRRLVSLDLTRTLAEVSLAGVVVGAKDVLAGPGSGGQVLEEVYDRAVAALAAEQVGGAQRCLEMTVDYARSRIQFGRPIGSFQAIKHKCADMLVAVESAKSAAYHATWAAAHDPAELTVAAPLAKAHCSEAYFGVAAETIQVHGGIGFTWEHDAHLYFKRAKSSEILLGSPARWRGRLAERLGL